MSFKKKLTYKKSDKSRAQKIPNVKKKSGFKKLVKT